MKKENSLVYLLLWLNFNVISWHVSDGTFTTYLKCDESVEMTKMRHHQDTVQYVPETKVVSLIGVPTFIMLGS